MKLTSIAIACVFVFALSGTFALAHGHKRDHHHVSRSGNPIKYRGGRAVDYSRGAAVSRDGYCDYDLYPPCMYNGWAFSGNGLAIYGGLPVVQHSGRSSRFSRP
jgi:hypothetical protein